MVAIALAESGGITDRVSAPNRDGSRDHGLFQINDKTWRNTFDGPGKLVNGTWAQWNLRYNPTSNAAMARYVYDHQGLDAWAAYSNGSYKQHLGRSSGNVAGQAIEDVTGLPVGESATAITNLASTVRRLVAGLTDAGTWIRIGMAILGAAMFLAGLSFIAADIGLSSNTATKLIKSIRPI
jgi:hypothetical protein